MIELIGYLKYVKEQRGYIDAMFLDGKEEITSAVLQFPEKAREMSNVEFKQHLTTYQSLEAQKRLVTLVVSHIGTTSSGKPRYSVISCTEVKKNLKGNYHLVLDKNSIDQAILLSALAKNRVATLGLDFEKAEAQLVESLKILLQTSKISFFKESIDGHTNYRLSFNRTGDHQYTLQAQNWSTLFDEITSFLARKEQRNE